MKKLLSITLVLIMCLSSIAFGLTVSAEDENLLAGASYTYEVGEFFSSFTDNDNTLLTNGKWRGDGSTSFNGMYAVSGTTVELRGDSETGTNRQINNVIVFNFDGTVSLDKLLFRGVRRIGNRYTQIVSIETSSNGTAYTKVDFIEQAVAISGAPQLSGADQYFDITANFKDTATKVRFLKVTLNSVDPTGALQYLVQLDEVEAYGSLTGKYTPAAEVAVSTDKNAVRPGEYFTVTVLVNNITAPNGIVACDLPLVYDNNVLRLTSCQGIYPTAWGNSGILLGEPTLSSQPYWLRLACDASDLATNSKYNVKASGVLGFTLTFKALAEGAATIAVDNVPENGDFMLVVNGADFENYGATGASVSVNVSGEPIISTKGDLNGDGVADNLDAVFVLRYDAGLDDLDSDQLINGDVNNDGVVDNTDAARILQFDAGLIPDL